MASLRRNIHHALSASNQCCLTRRSTGPATAGGVSLPRSGFATVARQAYTARLRGPVSSNVRRRIPALFLAEVTMPVVRQADQHIEKIEHFDKIRPNLECWLTEPGRLSQFGAFIHVLQPNTRSSIKHWHSDEDELVYVLEGEVTLIEGTAEWLLQPGDAATFRAGEPVGHSLWNKGVKPTKVLVIGTRAKTDRVTYPDHNRQLYRDKSQRADQWTDMQGNPASNPYSE